MTNIAIIPARGGSKRLPRKNILPVMEKPMLSYPVETARKSKLFDQVIVSTEDSAIKAAALQCHARVIERPKEIAGDRSTVAQVCEHVLTTLAGEGTSCLWFCCIYATALFLTPKDLEDSFNLGQTFPKADVIMGVSRFNLQPLQALEKEKDGFLRPRWAEHNRQSQFHPDLVASNGTLYWARTKSFLEKKTFYTERLIGYEIPWIRAIDVDTPEDYQTARLLAPLVLGVHLKDSAGGNVK